MPNHSSRLTHLILPAAHTLGIIVLAFSIPQLCSAQDEESAKPNASDTVEKANEFIENGELDSAIKLLTESIAKSPTAKLYITRGKALSADGQSDQAVADFGQAIKLAPEDAEGYRLRAYELVGTDRDAAALDLKKVVSLEPRNVVALSDLGGILTLTDNLAEGERYVRKAIEVDPTFAFSYSKLVQNLRLQDRLEEALAVSDQALKQDQIDWMLYQNRGFVLEDLGRRADAIATYTKAISLSPETVSLRNRRGNQYLDIDQAEKALQDFQKCLEVEPKNILYLTNAARALHKLGKPNEALDCLNQALDVNPKHDYAIYIRAQIHRDAGDLGKAITDYKTAVQLDPEWDDYKADLAEVFRSCPKFSSGDKDLLASIAAVDARKYVALVSPSIRPYVDQAAVAQRLQMIAARFPKINDAVATEISPDAKHGKKQTEITLTMPSTDDRTSVQLKIGRDSDGQLLGFEARGPDWSVSTMDALQGVDEIDAFTEKLYRRMFAGDVDAAIASLPHHRGFPRGQVGEMLTQMVKITKVVGRVKTYQHLDTIIEMPAQVDGEVSVSVYAMVTNEEDEFGICRLPFQKLEGQLLMSGLDFGGGLKANYISHNPVMAQRYAEAFGSGDAKQFVDLMIIDSTDDLGPHSLTFIFQRQVCQMAGALIGIKPGSLRQEIEIKDGDFNRSHSFVAEFENAKLRLHGRFEAEDMSWFTVDNELDWFGGDMVKHHLSKFAKADVSNYLNGSATETLNMLKGYGGYDSVTEETIKGIKSRLEKNFGVIQSHRIDRSIYDSENESWRFEFSFDGSANKGTGQIIYGKTGLSVELQNIGTN